MWVSQIKMMGLSPIKVIGVSQIKVRIWSLCFGSLRWSHLAWNANAAKHPIRIELSWFEASKLFDYAELSGAQSHSFYIRGKLKEHIRMEYLISTWKFIISTRRLKFFIDEFELASYMFPRKEACFTKRNIKKMNHNEGKCVVDMKLTKKINRSHETNSWCYTLESFNLTIPDMSTFM